MKKIVLISSLLMAQVSAAQSEARMSMQWSGDLRLRLNQAREADDDSRRYAQVRARLGVKADVNPATKAILRLATGTSSISTNQTLGDKSNPGMPRRGFGLDLGYVDWSFLDHGHLWAGRVANPFWSPNKVQTVFDSDLAFEGLAVKWEPQWSDSGAFVNLGAFIISENYSAPTDVVDTGLAGVDIGYKGKVREARFAVHAGTLHFLNIQNKVIGRVESGADAVDSYSAPFERHRGNTVYAPNPAAPADEKYLFKYQYTLFNAGGELRKRLSGGGEIGAFYEYVKNYAVGGQGHAHEFGLMGEWRDFGLSIARIDKGSDSVVGAYTDSDTSGGGTDNEGYRLQIGYGVAKNSNVLAKYFTAERGVDSTPRDYRGVQIDFSFAF